MKPKVAIGFDFDHTLGVDNKLERVALVRLVQQMASAGRYAVDEERGVAAIDREIAAYRAGRSSLEGAITHAVGEVLGDTAGQFGAVEAFRELAVSMIPEFVQALPGVASLLRAMDSASIPYAILTNGWNPLQQRKADFIGFRKPVFVSDDLGLRKPDVHAFNALRDYFALAPRQIWYVGDDPRVDVEGALSAGMNAIWFDWEHRAYPADVATPTAVVHDIGDALCALR